MRIEVAVEATQQPLLELHSEEGIWRTPKIMNQKMEKLRGFSKNQEDYQKG